MKSLRISTVESKSILKLQDTKTLEVRSFERFFCALLID